MKPELLWKIGGIALLLLIFGVPAVLVPFTMRDVDERSRIKVLTTWQRAINIAEQNFADHADPAFSGRLQPLPGTSTEWIHLINPMGRQAPGGGPALLPEADPETGAIGVKGDEEAVTFTLPAYGSLEAHTFTVSALPEKPSDQEAQPDAAANGSR